MHNKNFETEMKKTGRKVCKRAKNRMKFLESGLKNKSEMDEKFALK